MNLLDLFIALPFGYFIYKGFNRGLVFEVASLGGIVIGSILAVRLANTLSMLLGLQGENALLISFFIIFIIVIIASLALARMVEKGIKLVHAGTLNNIAGAVFGFAKGVCIIGVLLYSIYIFDIKGELLPKDYREKSMLFQPMKNSGKILVGKMNVYLTERQRLAEAEENANNDKQ